MHFQTCIKHTQRTNDLAEAHYRTIIRDLVAEALKLSDRLNKTVVEEQTIDANMELSNWVKVI